MRNNLISINKKVVYLDSYSQRLTRESLKKALFNCWTNSDYKIPPTRLRQLQDYFTKEFINIYLDEIYREHKMLQRRSA